MTKNSGKHYSITRLLKSFTKTDEGASPLTYGALVNQLGDQGFGIIAIVFALPSALPISVIPGFSFIFGLPIVFIAIQLIMARRTLWLPKSLYEKTVDRERLKKVIKKTMPYLLFVERLLKPRWAFFSSPLMERLHGIVLLALSLFLLLPIPFSNFIFAAIIICFGFGIAEKDGVFLVIAYIATVLYFLFLTSMVEIIKRFI
ncbi:MAG: exopolysaccharide biosynthesis protein [Legionella sp.]|nr:exopolysaccharide biosynthesis protein [Legionella sp.]